jgi:hypothetical protein
LAWYKYNSIQDEAECPKNEVWDKCIKNETLLEDFEAKIDKLERMQHEADYMKLTDTHAGKIERENLRRKNSEKY